MLIGLVWRHINGVNSTHDLGPLAVALECCFWLVSAILLLGGLVGIAAFLNFGRLRPRIVTEEADSGGPSVT